MFLLDDSIVNWLLFVTHRASTGGVRGHADKSGHDPACWDIAALVLPWNVLKGRGRACLDTLGAAVAQGTLGCLVQLLVKPRHAPRAGRLALFAAGTLVHVDHASVHGRNNLDGLVRAGERAGNGMRTLAARILNDEKVPEITVSAPIPQLSASLTKVHIP